MLKKKSDKPNKKYLRSFIVFEILIKIIQHLTQIIVKHILINTVSQVLGHIHALGSNSNAVSHASYRICITAKKDYISNSCR